MSVLLLTGSDSRPELGDEARLRFLPLASFARAARLLLPATGSDADEEEVAAVVAVAAAGRAGSRAAEFSLRRNVEKNVKLGAFSTESHLGSGNAISPWVLKENCPSPSGAHPRSEGPRTVAMDVIGRRTHVHHSSTSAVKRCLFANPQNSVHMAFWPSGTLFLFSPLGGLGHLEMVLGTVVAIFLSTD